MRAARSYDMSTRTIKARETEAAILQATIGLWVVKPLNEITLEDVAEAAGVTVRTVIRKYGSKEGLLDATIRSKAAEYLLVRNHKQATTWQEAIRSLNAEYEHMGDAVLRTLQLEDAYPAAKKIASHGRAYHAKWCADTFKDFLPNLKSKTYRHRLITLIAATDLYVWKLLRRDMKCSQKETVEIMQQMINRLINH